MGFAQLFATFNAQGVDLFEHVGVSGGQFQSSQSLHAGLEALEGFIARLGLRNDVQTVVKVVLVLVECCSLFTEQCRMLDGGLLGAVVVFARVVELWKGLDVDVVLLIKYTPVA
jgi:hypothetical protein